MKIPRFPPSRPQPPDDPSDPDAVCLNCGRTDPSSSFHDSLCRRCSAESVGDHGLGLNRVRPAVFDARAFVVPENDVCNYFLWRQQDATRNSIQMLARSLWSHKECHGKNNSELQEMCYQKGKRWDELPVHLRRGTCVLKQPWPVVDAAGAEVVRPQWTLDLAPPVFSERRDYIERLLALDADPSPVV